MLRPMTHIALVAAVLATAAFAQTPTTAPATAPATMPATAPTTMPSTRPTTLATAPSSTQPATKPAPDEPGMATPVVMPDVVTNLIPPTESVSRNAIPDAAALEQAAKLTRDAYALDWKRAIAPADKIKLAKQLLEYGKTDAENDATRYVTLDAAREVSIKAGDFATACKAIDSLDKYFEIDTLAIKLDTASATSKTVHSDQLSDLGTLTLKFSDQALKAERFEMASKFCDIAMSAAQMLNNGSAVAEVSAKQREIRAAFTAFRSRKSSEATLKDDPANPEANLALGKYYCFTKDDWDRGLPMLALGSDAALKAVAGKDLTVKGGDETEILVSVGDAWWDLAEKQPPGKVQNQMLVRAAKWYKEAAEDLSGLPKVRVDRRLKAIAAAIPAVTPTKPAAAPANTSDQ